MRLRLFVCPAGGSSFRCAASLATVEEETPLCQLNMAASLMAEQSC